jgi:hypothetical protein
LEALAVHPLWEKIRSINPLMTFRLVSDIQLVCQRPVVSAAATLRPVPACATTGARSAGAGLDGGIRSLADRLALTLVNRGQIGRGDFAEREGGAVLLEGDARKAVVVAYQERKQEELSHPLLAQSVPLGLLPLVQALLLARAIRGETEGYIPFVMR